MRIDEAHVYEDELREELKKLAPNHPAIAKVYYPSTWKAIDTYEQALEELKKVVIEECPFLAKCTNQNTSKCTSCLGDTGRKNYVRKDDEIKAVIEG